MMETTNQLLEINTVISHKVQCCERLVHVVYRAGIKTLRICGSFEVIRNKFEDSS
jgi:hypothetical protein